MLFWGRRPHHSWYKLIVDTKKENLFEKPLKIHFFFFVLFGFGSKTKCILFTFSYVVLFDG